MKEAVTGEIKPCMGPTPSVALQTVRDVDTGRACTHAPWLLSRSRSALTSSMTTYSGLRLTSS